MQGGQMIPAIINGKEYVSIHEFAKLVNKSYTTIYLLTKYGSRDGEILLESIEWNNRILVLLSEKSKMEQIAPVGHPPKREDKS